MKNEMNRIVLCVMALVVSLCGCQHEQKSDSAALLLVQSVHRSKDYGRLLSVVDSLEAKGSLIGPTANYWRGYACDRLKRKAEATAYWRGVVDSGPGFTEAEELSSYAKSASRLVNQLCLDGDFQGALATAQPITERLEALQCDTTSDYVNLLIYIGLCQVATSDDPEEAPIDLLRAIDKHRANIERKHTDEAYKDAIAGLVNIAFYCVKAGKPRAALLYTSSFGELLMEYESRPGVDQHYVDRQAGRYTIYKAWALQRLGRAKEAKDMFDAFLQTHYSQEPEGREMASNYRADRDQENYKDEHE